MDYILVVEDNVHIMVKDNVHIMVQDNNHIMEVVVVAFNNVNHMKVFN